MSALILFKFLARYLPVENILGSLLSCVGRLDGSGSQHVVDGLDDLCHLLKVDNSVPINVVHSGKLKGYFIFSKFTVQCII